MIVLPAFVEEFGVAAVIVAAQERTVTDPHKTVLLEDPLHAVVVGQGRAAHGCETHGVEDVYQESHGLGSVAPTAKVSGSDLYAQFAAVAAEVKVVAMPIGSPRASMINVLTLGSSPAAR